MAVTTASGRCVNVAQPEAVQSRFAGLHLDDDKTYTIGRRADSAHRGDVDHARRLFHTRNDTRAAHHVRTSSAHGAADGAERMTALLRPTLGPLARTVAIGRLVGR